MANEFGVTKEGFVLKRMDTILDQVHGDLSDGFGFDTATKSDSVINVLAVTFANQMAQAWETLQDVYYSRYPFSATGVSLDNSCQYGGVVRKESKPSLYQLHCTGDDGTVIGEGTIVSTYTKPEVKLLANSTFAITREKFNWISIGVATVENSTYSISLNGKDYEYANKGTDTNVILSKLAEKITDKKFVVTVTDDILSIACENNEDSYLISLSDNLMVNKVTTIGEFATEEHGSITIANRTITEIQTATNGFDEVTNLLAPILGTDYESDIELRQSYLAKCASRSSSMIDSICAAILINVENVISANGYENVTDEVNEDGLPPHSIEIIVDGGKTEDIAQQIHLYRAGGIQMYGSESYEVDALFGNKVPIRFSRPNYVYVWFKVTITGQNMPANVENLVQESLLHNVAELNVGDTMYIQKPLGTIYSNIAGVTNVEIKAYATTNKDYTPKDSDYTTNNIEVSNRQKIVTSVDYMEVS